MIVYGHFQQKAAFFLYKIFCHFLTPELYVYAGAQCGACIKTPCMCVRPAAPSPQDMDLPAHLPQALTYQLHNALAFFLFSSVSRMALSSSNFLQ